MTKRNETGEPLRSKQLLHIETDTEIQYGQLVRFEVCKLRKLLNERRPNPVHFIATSYVLRAVERHHKRITSPTLGICLKRWLQQKPASSDFGGLYELLVALEQHTDTLLYCLRNGDRLCAPADRVSLPGVPSCPALWYERKNQSDNGENDRLILDVEHIKEDYVGSNARRELYALCVLENEPVATSH